MGGGGGMLRAASRAMTRTGVANGGIQDPFASSPSSSSSAVSHGGCVQKPGSSSSSNNLTISAASGSPLNLPVAATSGWNGGAFSFVSSGGYEDFEWVSEEGSEGDYSVFGSVPSVDEVQDAVSALQQ